MKRKTTMKVCAVRLPPEFWNELQRVANQHYVTPSAIIRKAVAEYLKNTRKAIKGGGYERPKG